jgi:hypothetical protein
MLKLTHREFVVGKLMKELERAKSTEKIIEIAELLLKFGVGSPKPRKKRAPPEPPEAPKPLDPLLAK